MRTAIAINVIDDTMCVSTTTGLFSYDASDPAAPKLLGALPMQPGWVGRPIVATDVRDPRNPAGQRVEALAAGDRGDGLLAAAF